MSEIIVITGYKQSGKDTVADILLESHGFVKKMAFSDPLWEAALALDPWIQTRDSEYGVSFLRLSEIVARAGRDLAKSFPEVRTFLQRLGNEASREVIHLDVWAEVMVRRARSVNGPVAITGSRFPNEAEKFREHNAIIWRVKRPDTESDGHASESSVDLIDPDLVIDNDGSIDDLREKVNDALMVMADGGAR